jgi:hypothetical protein
MDAGALMSPERRHGGSGFRVTNEESPVRPLIRRRGRGLNIPRRTREKWARSGLEGVASEKSDSCTSMV